MGKDSFRRIYGDAPLQSDYAMWSLIAGCTPGKLTLSTSREESAIVPILVIMKAVAAPEESGIFSIQTGDFKGFQWGDPEAHPKRIVADLFSEDGGLELSFLGPAHGKPWAISQPEINRVLQTAHKVKQREKVAAASLTK